LGVESELPFHPTRHEMIEGPGMRVRGMIPIEFVSEHYEVRDDYGRMNRRVGFLRPLAVIYGARPDGRRTLYAKD
jgi:hypothetical protein